MHCGEVSHLLTPGGAACEEQPDGERSLAAQDGETTRSEGSLRRFVLHLYDCVHTLGRGVSW